MKGTNRQAVGDWLHGTPGASGHMTTDGRDLYSYALRIGFTGEDGQKVVLNYRAGGIGFKSMTTSHHVSLAAGYADAVLDVVPPTGAERAALDLMDQVDEEPDVSGQSGTDDWHTPAPSCDDPGSHAPNCTCDGGEYIPFGGPHMDTCSCGCRATQPRGTCECGRPVGHD